MHKIAIPQSVIDSVIRSRGREHIYDTLDPAKTALLVVDMQNGFMMEGVAHSLCREAVNIVPNINRIAEALRRSGGTIVWIQNAVTEETLESWSIRIEMDGPERTATRMQSMTPGTKGYALWAGLDTRPDDLFVQKTRFSAFIQGSSDLEAQLRGRGIDTVIVTGTVTNICCESTARDAMMRNFRTIMVSDANAAITDEMHNASLAAFYVRFGDIMSTDHLIGVLNANSTVRTAAQ
ncbi:MAG TPA: isochorismatase family cysteine hydrolase [Micropepsaceae bacterium]|nr:isochorismatase family cysteine hydrolase [Micropepsaceae bacterium]